MQTLETRINQINKLETQREFLELINRYNLVDRQVIKKNLKRILTEYGIKPKQIIELNYSSPNVYSWLANVNNNIPMFPQALHIAVEFDFDVREFLKEI
jgi:hypothetical protein